MRVAFPKKAAIILQKTEIFSVTLEPLLYFHLIIILAFFPAPSKYGKCEANFAECGLKLESEKTEKMSQDEGYAPDFVEGY